jgi:hypothetical protein
MSIKKILLSILVVVILGVVGYELYDYLPHILVKSSYRYMEFFPVPPYSFAQQEIIDEGTFTLPFLPPETAFSLDTNTFQLKREIEEMEDGKKYKGIDLEDLTVVELRFKNIEFLSLRIGLYSPTRGTVIESSSLAI